MANTRRNPANPVVQSLAPSHCAIILTEIYATYERTCFINSP